MKPPRFQTVGVALAVIFGAWLRFHRIGEMSLWFDEGYTAWAINHRPAEIIRLIRADTAPPLYYLLLYGWSVLFGMSETALRSFSTVLGIATIPLVAGVAARLLGRPAAVVAASWLFVLNFLQTWYSQEARGYELAAFLTVVMLYGVVRQLDAPKRRWLAMIIAAATASLYVNNFMPLYVLAVGAAAFVLPGSVGVLRRWRDCGIIALFIAVAYLPWIGSLASQVNRVNSYFWISPPTMTSVCIVVARMAGVEHFWTWDQYFHDLFTNTEADIPRAVALLLIVSIAGAGIFLRGNARRAALGLAVAALLPVIVAALYSLCRQPIFLWAAFVPSTVIAPVFLAGALTWIRRPWGAVLVGMVLLLSAVNQWAYFAERFKEDWSGAALAVHALPPANRRLIIFLADEAQLPFDYYYTAGSGETETGAPAGFFDVDPPRTQRRVLSPSDLADLRHRLATGNYDQIVLVASHDTYADPQNLTLKCLNESAVESERIDLRGVTLRLFNRR